jgi:hypothetical protein
MDVTLQAGPDLAANQIVVPVKNESLLARLSTQPMVCDASYRPRPLGLTQARLSYLPKAAR